jgi:PAS domain S-box-containing protein
VTGGVAVTMDITARRLAERKLQQSEALYRSIGESIDYGVWVCDPDGRNTYASESFLRMAGITQEQCSNLGWGSVLHPDDADRTIAAWQECVRTGGIWDVEHRIRGVDGQWHDVLARGVPVRNERGEITCWAGINLDIGRLKQAEHALRENEERLRGMIEELHRSNKELEQFAYVASHDLQEPLRMVTAFTGLLADRYRGQLDARADKYIASALEGATRMQKLIDALLAYSRLGGKTVGPPVTNAAEALRNALGNLEESLAAAGAKVTADALPTVAADGSQLAQVFQNLIGNCVNYRRKDVVLEIHVGAERRQGEWLLSVRDNGIGIDPQYFDRIFEIFQRLHGRQEYPGTGVGLAICRKVVERHGGRIWVESRPGQGSTFAFTIPDAPAAALPRLLGR